jgi:hypothetical protein
MSVGAEAYQRRWLAWRNGISEEMALAGRGGWRRRRILASLVGAAILKRLHVAACENGRNDSAAWRQMAENAIMAAAGIEEMNVC